MTSGGIRPGAGRPPKTESRATDRAAKRAAKGKALVIDDGTWVTLPREGRSGRVPAWPLSRPEKPTATSRRELVIWGRLWRTPQALAWDKVGTDHDQIAFYVRYVVEAEQSDATVGVRNLVRQYADGLGLTAAGMRMLKWRIGQPPKAQPAPAADAVEPAPKGAASKPAPVASTRDRLKLLAGSGNAGS